MRLTPLQKNKVAVQEVELHPRVVPQCVQTLSFVECVVLGHPAYINPNIHPSSQPRSHASHALPFVLALAGDDIGMPERGVRQAPSQVGLRAAVEGGGV